MVLRFRARLRRSLFFQRSSSVTGASRRLVEKQSPTDFEKGYRGEILAVNEGDFGFLQDLFNKLLLP